MLPKSLGISIFLSAGALCRYDLYLQDFRITVNSVKKYLGITEGLCEI